MTERQMPEYRSHKRVWALKIASVKDGMIYPANNGYGPIEASDEFLKRCQANENDQGYFVVYEDGFKSWSPSKAFEDGYTLIK